MSDALVSVLIPAYNAERWLAQALDSALGQDWPSVEVVVVDDGSTDGTLPLARSYEPRGVRVIAGPNRGASAARNLAFAQSRGSWIQFLDADDLLKRDKLSRQMARASTCGEDYVLCGNWARFIESIEDASVDGQVLSIDSDPVDWTVRKCNAHAMMHPGAWLASRALLQRAGAWDTRLSLDDDGEYFARVVLASRGTRYCEGALSYYRSGLPGSLSGQRSTQAHQSAFLACTLCANHLLAVEDSKRTREACANMFVWLCYGIYPDDPAIVKAAEAKVAEYGGNWAAPPGGAALRSFAHVFGWKFAKRIQRLYQRAWRPAPRQASLR